MGDRTIEHGGVSIEAPDGWVDASQVIALGPDAGGYRPSMVVSIQGGLRPDIDAQTFAEGLSQSLRTLLKGYKPVTGSEATFGPWTGYLREQTFDQGNLKLRQLQFHVVREGIGYVFSYTHLADEEDVRALAAAMFEQIQFGARDEVAVMPAFKPRPSIGG